VIATLIVVLLAAAAVGAAVAGLFWLTLLSFAGVLVTGAEGVSVILRPVEDTAAPPARNAELRALTTARRRSSSRPSEEAAQWEQAA
jgi:hypothetical protein